MISFQAALPLLVFLLICFLAFYFVETVILLILNWLLHKYWVTVVDKLLRTIVHHRILMRMVAFGSIALIILLLFIFTPLADLLVSGMEAFRLLAMVLVVTMILIYWIGSRSLNNVVIERRIHLYVFIVLSLLSFTGVMAMAQKGYTVYAETINQAFVKPIVENIEQKYEKETEDKLLSYFRNQVKSGQCENFDYASKTGTGITQFLFIKEDPALADPNPVVRPEGAPLAGKNCVHETTFLLTPEGKWYEVLERNLE